MKTSIGNIPRFTEPSRASDTKAVTDRLDYVIVLLEKLIELKIKEMNKVTYES